MNQPFTTESSDCEDATDDDATARSVTPLPPSPFTAALPNLQPAFTNHVHLIAKLYNVE